MSSSNSSSSSSSSNTNSDNNSKENILYPYACIYKLTLPDERAYIGSTPNPENRIHRDHRKAFDYPYEKDNTHNEIYEEARKYGNDFYKIIKIDILEEFTDIRYRDLHKKEYEYIVQHKTHMSNGGFNKQYPASTYKDWYERNKEEKNKACLNRYYAKSEEQRHEEYEINYNKEGGVKEKRAQKVICEGCFLPITIGAKANHIDSDTHKYLMKLDGKSRKELAEVLTPMSHQARTQYIKRLRKE